MSSPSDQWPDEPLTGFAMVLCEVLSWLVPVGLIAFGCIPLVYGPAHPDEGLLMLICALFGAWLLYFRLGGKP